MLASHVMGARQHVAERGAAQDEVVAGSVLDAEGEVRVTAGDQVEAVRSRGRRRRARRAIR